MARVTDLLPIPEHFRVRLIIVFVLFAAVFGGLFVIAIETSINGTEDYLSQGYLQGVTEHALSQSTPQLPEGFAIHSYLTTEKPSWLTQDIPAFHEDGQANKHTYVTAWPASDTNSLLVVELDGQAISDLEDKELPIRLVMLGIALTIILLALLVGIVIAYLMAKPLVHLTHSVAQIRTQHTEHATSPQNVHSLYGAEHKDEIGDLSRAFSSLLERMQRALHQERSFSHHVSHEFRSPLALIGNALALLKTTGSADEPMVRNNLQRIETATQRLQDRVQLFLALGTSTKQPATEKIDLSSAWQTACQHIQASMPEPIDVKIQITAGSLLETEAIYTQTLFENTLRNALEHGDGGICVELDQQHFLIENQLDEQADPKAARGFGYGLEIIRRVCQKAGWQLEIDQVNDKFRVLVTF